MAKGRGMIDQDRVLAIMWVLASTSVAVSCFVRPASLIVVAPIFVLGWAWFAMRRWRPDLTAPMGLVFAVVYALCGVAALVWLDSTFLAVGNGVLALLMVGAFVYRRRMVRPTKP